MRDGTEKFSGRVEKSVVQTRWQRCLVVSSRWRRRQPEKLGYRRYTVWQTNSSRDNNGK